MLIENTQPRNFCDNFVKMCLSYSFYYLNISNHIHSKKLKIVCEI